MDAKKLECPHCSAPIRIVAPVTNETLIYTCPFCSNTYTLKDGIFRTETVSRNIDEARILEAENERERIALEKNKERERAKEVFRNSKFSKVIIAFFIISLIFAVPNLSNRSDLLQGILCVLQAILLGLAWLLGMGHLNTKYKNLYAILAFLGLLLIIPILALM